VRLLHVTLVTYGINNLENYGLSLIKIKLIRN
jgi:hypothetical protein